MMKGLIIDKCNKAYEHNGINFLRVKISLEVLDKKQAFEKPFEPAISYDFSTFYTTHYHIKPILSYMIEWWVDKTNYKYIC